MEEPRVPVTLLIPDRGQNLPEPNPLEDPDPLLETGWCIDVETAKMPEKEPSATDAPSIESPIMATLLSQKRSRKTVQEGTESPSWLPDGWRMDVRVRASGATAGITDRYFMSPSGQRFRSKVEVLHYLETGSKHKIGGKMKSDAHAPVSDSPADEKKKKSDSLDFSDLKFDFKNPPHRVTWFRGDDSTDEWIPMTGNTAVPAAMKKEWAKAYTRLSQLESTRSPGSP